MAAITPLASEHDNTRFRFPQRTLLCREVDSINYEYLCCNDGKPRLERGVGERRSKASSIRIG